MAVHIESVHPSAVYEDTVYTQDAVVSLDSGPAFEVYDIHTIVAQEHIGTTQALEVLILLSKIQRSSIERKEIKFDQEDQPVFRGEVVEIDPTDSRPVGVLDIGAGTVLFYPDEADWTVSEGERLQLSRTTRHLQRFQ